MGTGRAEGKTTVRAAGSLEEQGFVDFLGCLDAALSGIVVLRLCLSSIPVLLIALKMKAATTALLLITALLDDSQRKFPSAPKYVRSVINLPRESSRLQISFQGRVLVPASMCQALKHTPQGTGRAVLSPGEEGTASRGT